MMTTQDDLFSNARADAEQASTPKPAKATRARKRPTSTERTLMSRRYEGAHAPGSITSAQANFLRVLLRDRDLSTCTAGDAAKDMLLLLAEGGERSLNGCSKAGASDFITWAKTCGSKPKPAPKPEPTTEVADAQVLGKAKVLDGTYTVTIGDERRTLRVSTQPTHANFKPGERLVSYLFGSENTTDYKSFGHFSGDNVVIWKRFKDADDLHEAIKVLVGDPHAAALAYTQESGNCSLCGRLLTVPESIERSMGPVCFAKAQDAGWLS